MNVKAVLFDLFDTLLLLESEEVYYPPSLRRLYEFLVENGVVLRFEDLQRVYFDVREEILAKSSKSLEEPHFNFRVSQTLHRLGYNLEVSDPVIAGATTAFAGEFMRYVSLDDDAHDALQRLYGKYKLGLVSNFAIPECARELLERFHLKTYFDVVIISGEVNRRKPSPQIFKYALEALGVEASEAVFVGDRMDFDITGPKKIGMKTVLIKRRSVENAVVKPNRVIARLGELLTAFEGL